LPVELSSSAGIVVVSTVSTGIPLTIKFTPNTTARTIAKNFELVIFLCFLEIEKILFESSDSIESMFENEKVLMMTLVFIGETATD
jgi:cell division ATPase FtsA